MYTSYTFGRVVDRSDYGDANYDFAFDRGGRLTGQSVTPSGGSATATTYGWYNSGLQASITSGSAVSSFRYDADGNRTHEKHLVGSTVYQDAVVVWDAMNRMTGFDDAGVAGGGAVSIDYRYDRVGNVRNIVSSYYALDTQGNVVTGAGTPWGQDLWYLHDSMNRVVVSKGSFSGSPGSGTIGRGTGLEIGYDIAGRRAYTVQSESYSQDVPTGGVMDPTETHWVTTHRREEFGYRADGQLTHVWSDRGYYRYDNEIPTMPQLVMVDPVPGNLALAALYTRDALGRVTLVEEYSEPNRINGGTSEIYSRATTWNVKSQVTQEVTTTLRSDGTHVSTSNHYYNASLVSGTWEGVDSGGTPAGQRPHASRIKI